MHIQQQRSIVGASRNRFSLQFHCIFLAGFAQIVVTARNANQHMHQRLRLVLVLVLHFDHCTIKQRFGRQRLTLRTTLRQKRRDHIAKTFRTRGLLQGHIALVARFQHLLYSEGRRGDECERGKHRTHYAAAITAHELTGAIGQGVGVYRDGLHGEETA